MKRLIVGLLLTTMVGAVVASECHRSGNTYTEAQKLAEIVCLAKMVLDYEKSSEDDKDQAKRILSNAQYRMNELSRGAAPGYRANRSPGMGYGFGPDTPPQSLKSCGNKPGKCLQI